MMKKHVSLAAALLAAGTLSAPALAADHYLSANAGISWTGNIEGQSITANQTMQMNAGYSLLGAIGLKYDDIRVEAEYGYQKNDINKLGDTTWSGNIGVTSLMANGYYDIDAGGFKPYITAGTGVARVRVSTPATADGMYTASGNETTIAYQVGAGAAVPVGGNVMLDARYRYFTTMTLDMLNDRSISSSGVLLGLRVPF